MELLAALKNYFGEQDVHQSEKNEKVYYCEKKTLKEKRYQIVYIDTSDKWSEPEYMQYFENVVIDKYYESEGFLQWNFYYFIITSKELIQANLSRKKEIENDESYTRKSILTKDEFIEWLNSFNKISEISNEVLSNDLYTTWVNCLRDKKLFFVYNSDKYPNYKQPVEDYIKGFVIEDIDEIDSNSFDSNSEPTLNKIDKLDLDIFREYPTKRNFDLGYVNLFHGANAVGKTSFFEAIELTITGEISNKSLSDNYIIKITDDLGNILKFPSEKSKYKKRDIEWYNSGVNRGNNLNKNFNKFNYFANDAAFQLKQDDESNNTNLEAIIADIALGREVNKLEERIISFNERFADYSDVYLKEFSRLNDNLNEKNRTIKELNKLNKDITSYKTVLFETLNNNDWRISNSDINDDFISKLDNDVKTIFDSLQRIQLKKTAIDRLSKENIANKLIEFEQKKNLINNIKNELLVAQRQKQDYLKELERAKMIVPLLNELLIYYKHEHFSSLIGIEKRIGEKSIELAKIKGIKELADSVLSNSFLIKDSEKHKPITQIEDEIRTRELKFNKIYDETEQKVLRLQNNIEELADIISDIKSAGQSFLKLKPEAEDCPLCNSHFSEHGLADAIRGTEGSDNNSIVLIVLKENLESISKELDQVELMQLSINKLKQLSSLLFSSSGGEKTVQEIILAVELNYRNIQDLTNELITLNTIQSQFNNSGISEERYISLMSNFKKQTSIDIISYTELEKYEKEFHDKQIDLEISNNLLEKVLNDKENQLKDLFNIEIQDEEDLSQKINLFQELENSFKQLDIYLDYPSNATLLTIIEKCNNVNSAFETYKNAYFESAQQNQTIELINKEIKKTLLEIEDIKPKQKRAQFAKEELTKLLDQHSKSVFLSEYIKKNKAEIVTIFKLIHSPREFIDINFEGDKINLLANDGIGRTLREISSGQRSSLALSIFLSLNKKLTKGPNIIMFDDPVAYVDDLNILSFFDYLRELVIKNKRQVFFATANDDLAFLFKKKFEFLENQFYSYKLERNLET